jgi:hypothetical protein
VIETLIDVPGLDGAVGALGESAAIFVADARFPDAPVVFVNRCFTRLTGLLHDAVLGRSWTLLDTAIPTQAGRAASIMPGRPIFVELPNSGYYDDTTTVCFTIHALRDDADRLVAYVGIALTHHGVFIAKANRGERQTLAEPAARATGSHRRK